MKDFHSAVKYALAVAPAAYTASIVGGIIDRKGFDAVTFALLAGAVTTADGSNHFTMLVEVGDAANLSDAVAAPAVDLQGSYPAINHASNFDGKFVGKITYRGNKRYVRCTMAETGTADASFTVVAGLTNAGVEPVSNPVA